MKTHSLFPIRFLLIEAILLFFLTSFPILSFAQASNQEGKTEVVANVAGLNLKLSGMASPNASIALSTKSGQFLYAAVADFKGEFEIKTEVNQGLSDYCLETVDFKRQGNSLVCFSESSTGDIVRDGLFLPPTIGLFRNEVAEGSDVTISGFSMPDSIVSIQITNSKKVSVKADKSGYYSFKEEKIKAGSYLLFAGAVYSGKESLKQEKGVSLKVLSAAEQMAITAVGYTDQAKSFLSKILSLAWPILLVCLFILIIILVLKRKMPKKKKKK